MHATHHTDRAVAPVVGIVLLLAITILLAGTIGAFMFDLSDEPAEAEQPTAAFEFESSLDPNGTDTVTIHHTNGESVLAKNLYVDIEDAECSGGTPDGRYSVASDFDFPNEEVSAGMTTRVGKELGPGGTTVCSGDLDLSNATVTIRWENSDGATGTYEEWQAD